MKNDQKVIFLIRHGNTEYNEKKLFRGHTDIPLDRTGIDQAEKTAKFLENISLDIIYSSPLIRAYRTAEIIKKHQKNNTELKKEEGFTDLDFGEWEGKGYDEASNLYPEIYNTWARDPFKTTIPGGEDINVAQKRSWDAFNKIIFDSDAIYLAIVTHRIITKLLIMEMLGINKSGIWKINQSPCCINIFEYNYGIFFVSKLNYNFHITDLKDGFFKID